MDIFYNRSINLFVQGIWIDL